MTRRNNLKKNAAKSIAAVAIAFVMITVGAVQLLSMNNQAAPANNQISVAIQMKASAPNLFLAEDLQGQTYEVLNTGFDLSEVSSQPVLASIEYRGGEWHLTTLL